jgi:hypothetical protein
VTGGFYWLTIYAELDYNIFKIILRLTTMILRKGFIKATIYFPLILLEKVMELEITEELKEKIINTKSVGKSKPCIFEIRSNEMLIDFEKVMELKITCK